MGYSTNESTLKKQLHHLEFLQRGQACLWTVEKGTVHYFAYKIREALYIARLNAAKYPELAKAADRFTIEVVNDTQVQARMAKNTTEATAQAIPQAGVNVGMEEAGITQKMGPQTADSIIEQWLANQPSNSRFHYPQANMQVDELLKLYAFTQTKHLLMFVAADGSITVQPHERDMEELAWSPEDV